MPQTWDFPAQGVNREYSTYSGEHEEHLDFLIKEVEGGLVSVQLKSLKPGDGVEIHGFYGNFRIKSPDDGRSYCFVATGTGIAPFPFVRTVVSGSGLRSRPWRPIRS